MSTLNYYCSLTLTEIAQSFELLAKKYTFFPLIFLGENDLNRGCGFK